MLLRPSAHRKARGSLKDPTEGNLRGALVVLGANIRKKAICCQCAACQRFIRLHHDTPLRTEGQKTVARVGGALANVHLNLTARGTVREGITDILRAACRLQADLYGWTAVS